MTTSRSYLLLALVIAMWGVHWPVMKVALHFIPPLWFTVARLFLGGVCMLLMAAARSRIRLPSRHDLPIVFSVGVLQMGAFLALINLALKHVDAGRSAILAYTTPIWVTPAAIVLLNEKVTWRKAGGLVLALAGVVEMVGPWGLQWSDWQVLLAHGELLLAALMFAVCVIHIRMHRWQASPLDLAPWQMLLGAAIVVPMAAVMEADAPIRWGPSLAVILAFSAVVATAFCFSAWVALNRQLPAVTLSLASLAVPMVGLVSSVIAIGEPLTATNAVGLALISLGLFLLPTRKAA